MPDDTSAWKPVDEDTSAWKPVAENIPQQQHGALVSGAIGAFKGAASTLFHAGDLIRGAETAAEQHLPKPVRDWLDSAPQGVKDFVGYGQKPLSKPEVQAGITPQGTAQQVGYGLEHAAEYAVPGSAEGTLAARAVGNAIRMGGVALAQTENPEEAAGAAAMGGIGTAALPGVAAAAKAGGADIAAGAARAGAGYALRKIPVFGPYAAGKLGLEGGEQFAQGVGKGFRAARQAYLDTKVANVVENNAAMRRLQEAYNPETAPRTNYQLASPVNPAPASVQPFEPMDRPMPEPGPEASEMSLPTPRSRPAKAPSAQPELPQSGKPSATDPTASQTHYTESDAFQMAKWLQRGGATAEDANAFSAGHWNTLAREAGIDPPDLRSQGRVAFYMHHLPSESTVSQEAGIGVSPQMVQRLQQTGAMPAAQQLRQMMGQ